MTTRFWGEVIDQEAAKQLGLDPNFTIVMMANQFDYIEDIHEAAGALVGEGYCDPEEVVEEIEKKMVAIELPKGFALVAMAPIDDRESKRYGIVDLSAHGKGEGLIL